MKKLLLSLFLIAALFTKTVVGQCIADENFKEAIISNCATCIDAGGCLLPQAKTLVNLDVSGMNIVDISGIEGFTSLKNFYCNNNAIAVIPQLPDSIKLLFCSDNVITGFTGVLPPKLEQLKCENNLLSSLPALPNSLQSLFCSDNVISELPPLPNNLDNLTCNDNHLFSLPPLPSHLTSIHANLNLLYQLPELPESLKKLFCEQNQLLSLPALPQSLTTLQISGNPIACLPELPFNIQILGFDFTNITCLPNLPAIFQVFSPLPLCINGQSNNCAQNPLVTGEVFVDYNGDGLKDADDIPFPGIAVKANVENWTGYTDQSGAYSMNAGFGGTYSFSVTPPTGNYTIKPAAPYSFTFNDTSGQVINNASFALHPSADIFDLGIAITPGQVISGIKTNYFITFTNKGPTPINGSVQFQYDDKIAYVSADVPPFLISGTVITWTIAELQPFTSQTITAKFDIPETVLAGAMLSFSALGILSGATDIYLNDNSVSDSVLVTATSNSNYKVASRSVITPPELASDNEEIEYTIYFQNNGTVNSQNLDVYDTLSANLNTASFAMLASSHNGVLSVTNVEKYPTHPLVLHWNFDDIKLPSNSNDPLDSRGFVKFKAKPLTTLTAGAKILNKSFIQLSNAVAPVITNTVTTNINYPVSISELQKGMIELETSPNPFEHYVNIKYFLPEPEEITLSIFNTLGTVIWQQTRYANAAQTITISMDAIPAGAYLLRLTGKNASASAKILKM
ncbi:MAG TPA: T9SS type A sorting domain-containing protein [Chitinophagales bacterium]|nr:T9SS type A sorting domain-containing protein [Chitinophagales bacterium]